MYLYYCTVLLYYSAYGAAVNGKIIALRCLIHEFDTLSSEVFVSSKTLRARRSYLSNCGVEVAEVIPTIISMGQYTGSFCIDFKSNSQGEIKFYEVNPRLCSNMAKKMKIFKSIFVPLAFAIQDLKIIQAKADTKNPECIMNENGACITPTLVQQSVPVWYKYRQSHPLYEDLRGIVIKEQQFYNEFIMNRIPFNYSIEISYD